MINQAVDDGLHQIKEDDADHTDEGDTDRPGGNNELNQIVDDAGDQIGENKVKVDSRIHAAVNVMKVFPVNPKECTGCENAGGTNCDLRDDVKQALADFSARADVKKDEAGDQQHEGIDGQHGFFLFRHTLNSKLHNI